VKVCVTGGAGYVGSVVAELLIARGHEVVVLDNLSTGHRDAIPAGCRLVEGDVRDSAALAGALDNGVEAVLHFAALSVVADSMRRPLDYFDNNVTGSTMLVRAMEKRSIRRLVFSSTAAVYGTPESLPITEEAPGRPENPYGWSKLTVEWMLAASRAAWGLEYVALRYFNAAGAVYEDLGKYDKALASIRRGLKLEPDNYRALFNAGVIMNKLGYSNKSIEYYIKSIAQNAKYPYSYLNLSIIYIEQNDYEKAIEIISKGIISCPCTSFLYYNRACFYVHQEKFELAIRDLINAVGLSKELDEYMKNDKELEPLKDLEQYRELFEYSKNS
jgi:hypothetical protein